MRFHRGRSPKTLDGGAAEVIGDTGRRILAMVEG